MPPPVVYMGLVGGLSYLLQRRSDHKRQAQQRARQRKSHSSLRVPGRHITVVATAAVPWMTGTAVNPTLRAAYLAHKTELKVTLLVPWIPEPQQAELFKDHVHYARPSEQEVHIRDWVRSRTGFEAGFRVRWYPAAYNTNMLGIFPVGDATTYVPDEEADVAVLEEPEHLTWHHHGARWTDKFPHVVGVMHTNYEELSRRTLGGLIGQLVGLISRVVNSALCSIHTHKIIKLSDAVQKLPRQTTQYVHGAAGVFLEIGDAAGAAPADGGPRFAKGAYTLGKVVWGKGWEELLDMLMQQKQRGESMPEIDAFGSGEALEAIKGQAQRQGLGLVFMGRKDHLDEALRGYKVFINSSTSDVVATTSVEALAMGKWVIAARHPCNDFISAFRNCLIYETSEEFSAHLKRALHENPAPLSPEERYGLSWEAATERFLDAAEISEREFPGTLSAIRDVPFHSLYNSTTGVEPLRKLIGAMPHTGKTPRSVEEVDAQTGAHSTKEMPDASVGGRLPRLRASLTLGGLSLAWS